MELYQKEKKKIQSLLIVGIILLLIFLIYMVSQIGFRETFKDLFTFEVLGMLIAITCYPLGIVYGWREMLSKTTMSAEPHGSADRYYTVQERTSYKSTVATVWFFKLFLVVCFGWLFGTIKAFNNLYKLKTNSVKI